MEHQRKRLSREERSEQILNVAMLLFAEKGFENSTTKEIAENSGVTEAHIFRYFPTKDAMWRELYNRWADSLKTVPPLEIIDGSALATLKDLAIKWLTNCAPSPGGDPLLRAVISRHGVRALIVKAMQEGADFTTTRILPVVIFGQQTGEIRKGDPTSIAACYFAFIVGINRLREIFVEKYSNVECRLDAELALLKP